ncbi:MAG: DUF2292 domain-containing protein [Candidatus Levyibacteriota bacterium]
MNDYSTTEASTELLAEIAEALRNIRGWGSVEIFVQDNKVVQIVERNIKKTNQTQTVMKTRS